MESLFSAPDLIMIISWLIISCYFFLKQSSNSENINKLDVNLKPQFESKATDEVIPSKNLVYQAPHFKVEFPLEAKLKNDMTHILQWASEGRGTRTSNGSPFTLAEENARTICYWNDCTWIVTPTHFYQYKQDSTMIKQEWLLPKHDDIKKAADATAAKKQLTFASFSPCFAIDSTHLLWILIGYLETTSVSFPVIFDCTDDLNPWKILQHDLNAMLEDIYNAADDDDDIPYNAFEAFEALSVEDLGDDRFLNDCVIGVSRIINDNQLILFTEVDAGALFHIDEFIMVESTYRVNLNTLLYKYEEDSDKLITASTEPFVLAEDYSLHENIGSLDLSPEINRALNKIYFNIQDDEHSHLKTPSFRLPKALKNAPCSWLDDSPCMKYGYNDKVLVCYDLWKGTHATFRMWKLT